MEEDTEEFEEMMIEKVRSLRKREVVYLDG